MNITESFQVYARASTVEDDRWLFFDASSTEVLGNISLRTVSLGVTELRTIRAIVNHFIEAEEVTEASTLAAIAAEFAE
jgi:hypothetical protein